MWFFKKKEDQPKAEEKSILSRLKEGLSKSSGKISSGLVDLLVKKKLDAETVARLEELLISADLGPSTSAHIAAAVAKSRFDKEVTAEEIKAALAAEIEEILKPVEKPLNLPPARPAVILMVGVNGSGKTTTMGKLAAQFRAEGKSVILAAGDTFRAAAVEQLKVWGERAGCAVVAKEQGVDAAALSYEALEKAQAEGADILMIDTAGRLQNKANLMEELAKIVRVLKKKMPEAPHAVLLVLDATTGQNAHSQVETFREVVGVTGLIVTKLDGTAKGGVVVGLARNYGLPVHAIGVGEGVEDLQVFSARDFAEAIAGAGS